jgi:tRNA pseudouridine55 synthase
MDISSVIQSVLESENNSALILIDKPFKMTSFGVISFLKRKIGLKKLKIGHAGTLDPLATGLLIVCTGKMTKLIDSFQGLTKEYYVEAIFGAKTSTYDSEGDLELTIDIEKLKQIKLEQINKIINNKFIGTIAQKPPAYSAIHISGKRAYELARKGIEFEIPTKNVEIIEFEAVSDIVDEIVENVTLKKITFKIVCSKGTYIRSLIHDLGMELGTGGYVGNLRRTKIGEYDVNDALLIENEITTESKIFK